MVASLKDTAQRLWGAAPYWRLSLVGAGVFTLTSAIYLWSGPSTPHFSPPPPIPPDPFVDKRLSEYESDIGAATKVSEPGKHCELVLDALRKLAPGDAALGRNPASAVSSRNRIAAINEGERCHTAIAQSDQHFDQLAQAANQANPQNPKGIAAAIAAFEKLDDFDRSRPRYASEPAIAQVKSFGDLIEQSKARIKALGDAVAAAQGGTPANLIKLSAVTDALTDLDKARLTPDQQGWLTAGRNAAQQIQESHGKLVRLTLLLKAAQGNDATAQQHLIEAAASVTPLDETLATPEEKQTIEQARTTARGVAWNLLQQRLAAIDQDKNQPRNYPPAVQIYQLLKDVPQGGLTDAQKALLARGKAAADALADSDTRLKQLVDAAQIWQKSGTNAGPQVIEVAGLIRPFDQARFGDPEKQAWDILGHADAIVRGPELGLTSATKPRMPIFVETEDTTREASVAIKQVRDRLRAAGFIIADKRDDTALVANVSVQSVEEPRQDTANGFLNWTSTAHLTLAVTWAIDGSSLLSGPIEGVGKSQNHEAVRDQALTAAVSTIVARFQALTVQH